MLVSFPAGGAMQHSSMGSGAQAAVKEAILIALSRVPIDEPALRVRVRHRVRREVSVLTASFRGKSFQGGPAQASRSKASADAFSRQLTCWRDVRTTYGFCVSSVGPTSDMANRVTYCNADAVVW